MQHISIIMTFGEISQCGNRCDRWAMVHAVKVETLGYSWGRGRGCWRTIHPILHLGGRHIRHAVDGYQVLSIRPSFRLTWERVQAVRWQAINCFLRPLIWTIYFSSIGALSWNPPTSSLSRTEYWLIIYNQEPTLGAFSISFMKTGIRTFGSHICAASHQRLVGNLELIEDPGKVIEWILPL